MAEVVVGEAVLLLPEDERDAAGHALGEPGERGREIDDGLQGLAVSDGGGAEHAGAVCHGIGEGGALAC